jgi:hypothetical protein
MALEWMDGFDQYGSAVARLLDGVYAEQEGASLSTANPRTGTRHLRINAAANDAGVRRVFSEPLSAFGVAYAFSISKLPTDESSFALLQARNPINRAVFTVTVGPSGDIYIRNGGRTGEAMAHYVRPAVFANAYQHFELKFDDGFKLYLNEVLVIDSAAVPSGITGGIQVASVKIGNGGFPLTGALDITWDVDDLFAYNLEGDANNDIIGDCKVYTRFPNADASPQDFDISSGADGYAMLDNVPPQDATEYLTTDGLDVPKRSAFTLPALPLEIVQIRGVMLSTRMFKTDAGSAKLVAGVVSDSVEQASPEHAISMAPIWYGDVFDVDPATEEPWTISAVNDLTVFIERTE